MSPDDVPAELVETGGETLHSRLYFAERITFDEAKAAVAEVLAAVLPLAQAAAAEPYLVEWATEVDDLGTKAIWDSEAEARAEAKRHGQRLFRIEWTEAEQLRPQDDAQAPQDGANDGDVGSGRGEGVSTPQRGAQAPGEGEA